VGRELLELFDIPVGCFRSPHFERVSGATSARLCRNVPVAGIVGDQQAALFGQRCAAAGLVKCSSRTGCFMMMNTGTKPIRSRNALLTTIAWSIGGKVTYALEGGIFVAEEAVGWLQEGLGLIRKQSDIEKLAATVPDNGGVYMVPAFSGLGAPHWNRRARGLRVGLTPAATAAIGPSTSKASLSDERRAECDEADWASRSRDSGRRR
jgi:glycerol kinase